MQASKVPVRLLRTRWIVAGLVMLALAGTAWPQSTASEAAGAEQELFRLANRARAQAGLAELEWNEWLAQAARKHAEEMARRGQLSHQFPGELGLSDRIAATQLRSNAVGENVAFGAAASEIHNDWMHSPGHRANILDAKYNAMGVAVVRSGDRLYAVTDFAHTVPMLSASEVEDAVATAINQVREQKNLRPLPRRQDAEFRRYACEMARLDRVNASGLLGRPGVSASLAFTDPDPANFISHFRSVANVTTSRAFGVGACSARSATYPEGTNWVVVAFY
jgi:uncharacterized protein YkwD